MKKDDFTNYHKFTGKQFYELRKSYGMNQTKFAKMLGYTNKSYISQMETGYREVPKQVAFLCHLLREKGEVS